MKYRKVIEMCWDNISEEKKQAINDLMIMLEKDDYESKRFSDIVYVCQKCKQTLDWTAMSDETDLQLCNYCDMKEMYEE